MIGTGGKRESRNSILSARFQEKKYDDDDDFIYVIINIHYKKMIVISCIMLLPFSEAA